MQVIDKKTGKKKDVKLPKEFKKKWIAALRSGEFKQNHDGFLEDRENRYCCLGVACKITHPKLKIKGISLINYYYFKEKAKKLRLPSIIKGGCNNEEDDYNAVVEKLTNMNDSGKSFKVIATYIEKNL